MQTFYANNRREVGQGEGLEANGGALVPCPRALIAVTFVTLLPYDYGFIRLSPGL